MVSSLHNERMLFHRITTSTAFCVHNLADRYMASKQFLPMFYLYNINWLMLYSTNWCINTGRDKFKAAPLPSSMSMSMSQIMHPSRYFSDD